MANKADAPNAAGAPEFHSTHRRRGVGDLRSSPEPVARETSRSMSDNPLQGWVLYDDSCGFCRRWIPFWKGTLSRRGFATSPLQAEWVRRRLSVPVEELLRDLLLLLDDGRLIRGADVYRHVMQRIWWAYPVFLFSLAPLGRQAFDWGYRAFARN